MRKSFILLLILILFSTACTFSSGSTRDVVQGWDRGIIWNHAYLKNDHTTAYCFDDGRFIQILDEAQKTQREVIITYETYFFRGSLCTTSEKFDNVVVVDVRFAN